MRCKHPSLPTNEGHVCGVATGDMGITESGEPGPMFMRGMELHAKQVIFAEGAKGSLSTEVIEKFDLAQDRDPQSYGLGLKEIW